MIKTIVYEAEALLKELGEKYFLLKIPYTKDYSDDYDDNGTYTKETYFITTLPNIKKIQTSFWGFGSDTKVFLDDGTETHLSSSRYEGRNDILNRDKNNVLSRPITMRGKFIETESSLDE